MQIVGSPCQVCSEPIGFAIDAARCSRCGAAFHQRCRHSERCPRCDAVAGPQLSRLFAQCCPACHLSTAGSVELVCRGCGARTGWDDFEELGRYQAECRAQAVSALWRGALQLALVVVLMWVGIRIGLGSLVAFGLASLAVIVPMFGVSILLSAWGLRSLHAAWCLSRPVRLRAKTAPD